MIQQSIIATALILGFSTTFSSASPSGSSTCTPRTTSSQRRCAELPQHLSLNATATYIPKGTVITIPPVPDCIGTYEPSYTAYDNFCRVQTTVPTSNRSEVYLEAWLPDLDVWHGRFLALGNGGISQCLYYNNLNWGAGWSRMATVNTNNGLGGTAASALNNEEVLKDYAGRALEVEHDVGLEITKAYYHRKPDRNYYMGCSTGGRQGFHLAKNFPSFYDGIIAGSPAINTVRLAGFFAKIGLKMGVRTNPEDSKLIIGMSDLPVITKGTLEQCDGIDGVKNGIIDEPQKCDYRPEKSLCTKKQLAAGNTSGVCLTKEQVEAVRALFTPLYDENGEILTSAYDPGSTSSVPYPIGNGVTWNMSLAFYRYIIYSDSSYSLDGYSAKDFAFADNLNPGGMSSWDLDLSGFKSSGAKLLSYHGTADFSIPSGNTRRYYEGVKKTLGNQSLDPFWKHFVIPGMDHCAGSTGSGVAAWNFGQFSAPPQGLANDSTHNILWSMVDWVEKGVSPQTIIGTKFVDDIPTEGIETQRTYCPYPKRSVLGRGKNGNLASSWRCLE